MLISLSIITGGKTPLNSNGIRVWPIVGDQADAVFVEASCSAEAIARKARRHAVIYNGNFVFGLL